MESPKVKSSEPVVTHSPFTFSDFPEDVQLCILSFLTHTEIFSFALTSKRFFSLWKSDAKLWFSICDRRWGPHTKIRKWGNAKISFRQLYRTLNRWDHLIGFWRRSGAGSTAAATTTTTTPPLIFFEWGASFITGSRVSPSKDGSYGVTKTPFIWMGVDNEGEAISFLDPDCRFGSSSEFVKTAELGTLGSSEADLVLVTVNFMGENYVVVEENRTLFSSSWSPPSYSPEGKMSGFIDGWVDDEDANGVESTSPGALPGRMRSELYQYIANRTSPSGDRASRRQRKKERERLGRRKWEPEHYIKIVNSAPTLSRPLQGLWKGICDDLSLDFYLVAYDDIGGIACRRVGDPSDPFSGYSPVFWTPNTTFMEPPFSTEERSSYDSRIHVRPPGSTNHIHEYHPYMEDGSVVRILGINSSYDLVIPEFSGTSVNPRQVEGRIWLYANGTFGFGFLRNDFIIDLKHIALNGCLVDTVVNDSN